MISQSYSRLIDVSVVMTLCAALIVISALVLILEETSRRQPPWDQGARALLWAHLFYLLAASGLELGKKVDFSLSAPLVVIGTSFGLTAGYLGIRSVIEKRELVKVWMWITAATTMLQALLAASTGNPALTFVVSSLLNGGFSSYFAIDIYKRASIQAERTVWLLVLPFAVIASAYLLRIVFVGLSASSEMVVVLSVAIGLVFPMATIFWVFGAMSLRNLHLTQELDKFATQDALTGLGNRVALDRFRSALPAVERRRSGRCSACLCIDLDRFKEINDKYGHAAGDAVLVECARRMIRGSKANDKIFRIGGDEFVYWREYTEGEDIDAFAKDLLEHIFEPISFGKIELTVGASIGIEFSNEDISPCDVIRRADVALYRSKESGKSRVTNYTENLGALYDTRLVALTDFRKALENDQIVAYFQPQINSVTGDLTGFEALARWKHPERGILNPSEFMYFAEELSMLHLVDGRILELATEAMRGWAAVGLALPKISVNVSKEWLKEPSLVEDFRRHVASCPGQLAIKIQESVCFDDDNALISQVGCLKNLGIDIEIHKFGTGRTSISSVQRLRPKRIKIDRRFVTNIDVDRKKLTLLSSLVSLCQKLGAKPILAGVETSGQIKAIQGLGALEIEGPAVSNPMNLATMSSWLCHRNK